MLYYTYARARRLSFVRAALPATQRSLINSQNNAGKTMSYVPEDIPDGDIGDGINRAERGRVHSAIESVRDHHKLKLTADLHQAHHKLATRGGRTGNIAFRTTVTYFMASSRTVDVREDDAVTPDIADAVCAALSGDDPDVDGYALERVRRVREAVQTLPQKQYEALVRWFVVATVRGQPALTETEERNYRRAAVKLRDAVGDLATGKFLLREPSDRDPLDQFPTGWSVDVCNGTRCYAGPTTKRQGEPQMPHIDTRTPQRMLDGIAYWSQVRPDWRGFSPPPVPTNWATHQVVNGVCETCAANPVATVTPIRRKRKTKNTITSIQGDNAA